VDNLKDAQEAGGPESLKCTLYITEGVSAKAFAVKGIENGNYFGVLPIKGKLLNVGTCSIE
jgi:DNA topoisomerase-2